MLLAGGMFIAMRKSEKKMSERGREFIRWIRDVKRLAREGLRP